jgi:hypothetical protein
MISHLKDNDFKFCLSVKLDLKKIIYLERGFLMNLIHLLQFKLKEHLSSTFGSIYSNYSTKTSIYVLL